MSKSQRRTDILRQARQIIMARGLADTEMEGIRLACGISRGGLYHHFANKRAILDCLAGEDVAQLAARLEDRDDLPILALLEAGSTHLGAPSGMLSVLRSFEEKTDYLNAVEQAFTTILKDALSARMGAFVRDDVNAEHVAELFLTINAHINRRDILGAWSRAEAADFAATALAVLAPLLKDPKALDHVIASLKQKASSS